jgi:cytochrome c
LIGPSYNQISEKYSSGDKDYLTDKILRGGSGVWDSKMAMSAHPDLNETQAGMILDYIIDLKKLKTNKTLPVKGRHIFKNLIDNDSKKKNLFVGLNNQKFVFRASYLDNGFKNAPELLGTDVIVLRNPIVPVTNFDVFKNVELNHQITISRSSVIPEKTNSYIGLNDIDFTGIRELKFNLSILPESKGINFGHIEIRINSFEGQVLGDFKLVREGENGLLKYNNMKIKNIDGIHDLYVVFKMSNESSEINNIELRSLEFIK